MATKNAVFMRLVAFCKRLYKIKQNKRILADLNRRVEFVDKLLFMESLVTGWRMLWENSGKDSYLFP